jgi:hypothetical protein
MSVIIEMPKRKENPLFTRSEKKRVRRKVVHKIKGAARTGIARLFGIPLSPGLGGSTPRKAGHRSPKPATRSLRADVVSALQNEGYSKRQAEQMIPSAQAGESFDSLFRRAVKKNPGELIIFGNPGKVYSRKSVLETRRKGNPIPAAIIAGFEGALGSTAAAALTAGKKRKRKNPNSLDRADELFKTFHHRDSSGVYTVHASAKRRKDYTILGPLVSIGINAAKFDEIRKAAGQAKWEDYKVEHWDRLPHLAFLDGRQVAFCKRTLDEPNRFLEGCPLLASSPNGQTLYAITPDGVDLDLKQFDTDATKDLVDLGEATFVVYIAKKPDTAYEWVHELGEEGGVRPRLAYDRIRREIFFVGGSYKVEGPGIVN